jgi:hypothetical protein
VTAEYVPTAEQRALVESTKSGSRRGNDFATPGDDPGLGVLNAMALAAAIGGGQTFARGPCRVARPERSGADMAFKSSLALCHDESHRC